jgi:aspartyl-tRNA synthetase
MEASFVGQDDVIGFVSEAVADAAEAVTGERPDAFARMSWTDAMERFGTDKPDTRFGLELAELTDLFDGTGFRAFRAPCVKGLRLPGGAELTRRRLDELTDKAKSWGAMGLVWIRVERDDDDGAASFNSPVAKFLSEAELDGVARRLDAEPGDCLFLVAANRQTTRHVLGLLRLELGRPPVNEGGRQFLWVVEFPLFEGLDDDGRPVPAHHPFTMPHPDDLAVLDTDDPHKLLGVRSQAYDLVLNGWELGSGSVRIHRPDVQRRIFTVLGIGDEDAQRKFGFLLDAFRYGAPPHAGFAFGIDRLAALLAGEENIREIVAFPKTQTGADPLTGAPGPISPAQLDELGIRVLPPPPTDSRK